MLWELSVAKRRYRAVLEAGSMAGSGGIGRPRCSSATRNS